MHHRSVKDICASCWRGDRRTAISRVLGYCSCFGLASLFVPVTSPSQEEESRQGHPGVGGPCMLFFAVFVVRASLSGQGPGVLVTVLPQPQCRAWQSTWLRRVLSRCLPRSKPTSAHLHVRIHIHIHMHMRIHIHLPLHTRVPEPANKYTHRQNMTE